MPDAGARWIKIHTVLLGESLDGTVFGQVGVLFVLDIMIEGEDELFGIVNLLRANGLKFLHHRRRVVVRHNVVRANGDEVSGAQRPFRSFGKMRFRDFFNGGLAHGELL